MLPNSPAWPAMPPMAKAFKSWTSPTTTRPRTGQRSVGATWAPADLRPRTTAGKLHEADAGKLQRPKEQAIRQHVEALAHLLLDERAQQDETKIRVERTGSLAGRPAARPRPVR